MSENVCEGERRIWVRPVEGKLRRKSNITLALNVPRRRQLSPHPISNVDTQLLPFQCIHHALPYQKIPWLFLDHINSTPTHHISYVDTKLPFKYPSSASPSFQDFPFWKIQFLICVDIQYRTNPIHWESQWDNMNLWMAVYMFKNHIWKAAPIKHLLNLTIWCLKLRPRMLNGIYQLDNQA